MRCPEAVLPEKETSQSEWEHGISSGV